MSEFRWIMCEHIILTFSAIVGII